MVNGERRRLLMIGPAAIGVRFPFLAQSFVVVRESSDHGQGFLIANMFGHGLASASQTSHFPKRILKYALRH